MTVRKDTMEQYGEGIDPTAGGTAGSETTTIAPTTTGTETPPASSTPGTPGNTPTPPAQQPMSIADVTRLLGRRPTKQELKELYGQDVFDQSDLNSTVQQRLARERSSTQAVLDNMSAEYQRRLAELQQLRDSGESQEQLVPIVSEIQRFREQMEDLQLDRDLTRLSSKYADFGPNETDILQIALKEGLSPESAYKVWKYEHVSGIDIAALQKKAVEDYVRSKTGIAASAPRVEGPGGSAPVESPKHDGSWETAIKRSGALSKEIARGG